jgi:sugar lactone lactonase YvrE
VRAAWAGCPMDGWCVYRLEPDGQLALHADLSEITSGPANDMFVDEHGRAYVGNFGFDLYAFAREHPNAHMYAPPGPPSARIACLAPDGRILGTSAPVLFPNGAVRTRGGTLIVAESSGLRLTEFAVDHAGMLGSPRLWAPLVSPVLWRLLTNGGRAGVMTRRVSALLDRPAIANRSRSPISPDGIALHHDGETVWVANSLRGECVRVARGGRIVDRVRTSQHTLSCPAGRTLFLATVPTTDPFVAGRLDRGRIEVFEL